MLGRIINRYKLIKKIISINNELNCIIDKSVIINSNTKFEGRNQISRKTVLNDSYIGYGSYIADNCTFFKTKIGKFCSIADNVKIIGGNHPTKVIVSTHPLFYTNKTYCYMTYGAKNIFEEFSFADENKEYYCIIGNDVWIGSNVKIINGVNIADGAIVTAGAVVTKNVPPYSIAGGIPAKIIGYRFTDDQINHLLEIKWWNKDETWIKEKIGIFSNAEDFIKNVIKYNYKNEKSNSSI